MDHFENIIKTLLEAEGYWVRQAFKVNLTKEEKQMVGKPSMPRPEIDLLALRTSSNELLVIEAKSFLDSNGVRLADLQEEYDEPEGRYKLFTSERYRSVVMTRLRNDLIDCGMANDKTKLKLGLAAGHVYQGKSEAVRELFQKKQWWFWAPEEIRKKVFALSEQGYENDPAVITAKILAQ